MQTPRGIEHLKSLVLFAASLQLAYQKIMADGHVGLMDAPTIIRLVGPAANAVENIAPAPLELADLDQGEAIELVGLIQENFGHILPPGTKADAITAAALKAVPNLVGLFRSFTLDGPPVPLIVDAPAPPSDKPDV